MDFHGVADVTGVAAGERRDHGHSSLFCIARHQRVALRQAFHRQRQAAKLIFAKWIGSGDGEQNVWAKFGECAT